MAMNTCMAKWHIPTIDRAHLVGLNTGMDPIIGSSEQEVDKTLNFHGITEGYCSQNTEHLANLNKSWTGHGPGNCPIPHGKVREFCIYLCFLNKTWKCRC